MRDCGNGAWHRDLWEGPEPDRKSLSGFLKAVSGSQKGGMKLFLGGEAKAPKEEEAEAGSVRRQAWQG